VVVALVLGAIWLERREVDRRLVVLLGVAASLLLPAALWYHYLVVLLPFGVAAWLESRARFVRAGLVVGAVCISLALGIGLALATFGAVLFAVSAARGLWSARAAPTRGDPAPSVAPS
jgi:type IV secretory pathway TrbD component